MSDPTALIPLFMLASTGAIWLWLLIESHNLFYAFRNRYPEEARLQIKHAFVALGHPSKFLYFLSAGSKRFLEGQCNHSLLSRRRRVTRLTFIAVALPLSEMIVLAAFVLLFTDL